MGMKEKVKRVIEVPEPVSVPPVQIPKQEPFVPLPVPSTPTPQQIPVSPVR